MSLPAASATEGTSELSPDGADERDGIPLPGRTVPDVVSQLAFRVLGPYKNRARSILSWTGLPDQSPPLQREVAARYGVTPRAIGQRIQRVTAAGRRLPLTPAIQDDLYRPDRTDDPEVRGRCALLLGFDGRHRSPHTDRAISPLIE